MFLKFPPLFTYKKEKTGNYTFGGLFNELMEDVQAFLNVRYESLYRFQFILFKRIINSILLFDCKTSFRYTVIDPAEISKYSLYDALRKHLDNKVSHNSFVSNLFVFNRSNTLVDYIKRQQIWFPSRFIRRQMI